MKKDDLWHFMWELENSQTDFFPRTETHIRLFSKRGFHSNTAIWHQIERVVARWNGSIDVKSEPREIRKVLIFKAYSSAIVKW